SRLRYRLFRPFSLASSSLLLVSACIPSSRLLSSSSFFFFNDTATTEIYTLSLHDALPICVCHVRSRAVRGSGLWHRGARDAKARSEEHTSELQSRFDLVCRLLLEKKKEKSQNTRGA